MPGGNADLLLDSTSLAHLGAWTDNGQVCQDVFVVAQTPAGDALCGEDGELAQYNLKAALPMSPPKPALSLLPASPNLESLVRLFVQLTGRQPSDEDLARAQETLRRAQSAESLESAPRRPPRPALPRVKPEPDQNPTK